MDNLRICVVVPTYNERENLLELVQRVRFLFSKDNELGGCLVIVDDNSPDGTGELADQLAREYGNIMVFHRQAKLGIGSAYREAFQMILNELDVDVIFEMDADLSHDPAYIPSLVRTINEGYDVVVGSRYMDEGGINHWSLGRRMISEGANFLAKRLTGIKVRDVTSGFRAYRVEALRSIDLMNVKSDGYAFQVEVLHRCAEAGLMIGEYPIVFKERSQGKSKLGNGAILEFMKTLLSIAFSRVHGALKRAHTDGTDNRIE